MSQDPARIAALDALLRLWNEGGILDESEFRELKPAERARALRLTRETIRQEAGFDFIIKKFASKKPQTAVRAILHLALYELIKDQSAAHGVVHDWVEIAKSRGDTAKAAGFINAHLRQISQNPPLKLNPTNQYGKKLRAHLMTQYSSSILDQVNKAQSQTPPVDIRLKAGLDQEEWAEKLGGMAIENSRTVRLEAAEKLSARPGFNEGAWWVQDVAASVAVDQFADLAGKNVLDLCAAPGGKTMQLADAGAQVTALDISKSRIKRIKDNLERTQLSARLVQQDALHFQAEEPFDAILLDAPCSATGTMRRHPELRFDEPLKRMESLNQLQFELLEKAFSLLKTGGELIYVVCSLLHEESTQQIERFLAHEKTAKVQELTHPWTGERQTHLRILPNLSFADGKVTGCDGFFIAKICKLV